MKKKFIKLLIIIFTLAIFIPLGNLVFAQDEEITPTPKVTSEDENVKEIREAVQDKVKDILEENQQGEKRGYSGPIMTIENLNLTLQTTEGEKVVKVATDAAIIGQSGKEIELEDLKKNLFVVAMGYITEEAKLEIHRLVVQEKPKASGKEVINGIITDISTEEEILTIKNEKKGLIFTVEIDKNTEINRKGANGKTVKAKFSDLEENDRLFVIGEPTENEHKIITASIILAIAGPEEEKTSTPSSSTSE